eukprot:CAMPEP_0171444694 /NCGR_PEP_ID=MMETSP0881-20121228/34125_1 /TAXON_ID=67004 /ORGANISM="Thalassiosira weissflogii, Strain CCMP1336" /LENGTH=40 /DNA_ID= /DNA_START= /DNA_END= /DNA_ORIENTATION=
MFVAVVAVVGVSRGSASKHTRRPTATIAIPFRDGRQSRPR